jgi:hypothetical protein
MAVPLWVKGVGWVLTDAGAVSTAWLRSTVA